jgi:hypothetical protein
MSGLNDTAILGLLLGTFVLALTAIVIAAGHRGRRVPAHRVAEHRGH